MKVVVALKDKVSGLFMQPFFVPSVGIAYRSLQDEAQQNKDFVVARHPKDFALYCVGNWEEESGSLLPLVDGPALLMECEPLLKTGE